jgi:hypothetical protein
MWSKLLDEICEYGATSWMRVVNVVQPLGAFKHGLPSAYTTFDHCCKVIFQSFFFPLYSKASPCMEDAFLKQRNLLLLLLLVFTCRLFTIQDKPLTINPKARCNTLHWGRPQHAIFLISKGTFGFGCKILFLFFSLLFFCVSEPSISY